VTTNKTRDDEPVIRPFADFLREQGRGKAHEELSEALHKLTNTVHETGNKGTLVFTVPITEYVVGFALDHYGRVALIRKNRPEWQAGLLNGIGGHVEPGEAPDAAMVREFEEETGRRVGGWDLFLVMDFPGARIHFYRTQIGTAIMDGLRTTTDEVVCKLDARDLGQVGVIPNLRWLVPLAAYTADTYEPIHVRAAMAEVLTRPLPPGSGDSR